MYKISVIIPVYNAALYIDECIASLQAQTIGFDNLEVIMVDDCSTDDSRERMGFYAQKYTNVVCIYLSENSGAAGKPRNEGMKVAHAEYLMFLDPDDKYAPDACKVLLDKLEETGCDMVSGYYGTFESEEGILEENALAFQNIREKTYSMPNDLEVILKFRYHFAAKIYKKSIIDSNSVYFPERIIGQDSVFFLEYLFHTTKVYYMQMPVLQYRQRNQENKSVSYDLSKKHFCDIAEAMKMMKELFVANGVEEKLNLIFDGVLEYYMCQMIDSDLNELELCDILQQWEWLFEYECKEEISYSNIVLSGYYQGNFSNLAKIIVSLRSIKKYIGDIERARDWWKTQSDNKDNELKEVEEVRDWWKAQSDSKDKALEEVEEARDWWKVQSDNKDKELKKVEEARDWWKNQSQNYEQQILELKKWTVKLEEAKQYFVGEIKKRDEIIEQLRKDQDEGNE